MKNAQGAWLLIMSLSYPRQVLPIANISVQWHPRARGTCTTLPVAWRNFPSDSRIELPPHVHGSMCRHMVTVTASAQPPGRFQLSVLVDNGPPYDRSVLWRGPPYIAYIRNIFPGSSYHAAQATCTSKRGWQALSHSVGCCPASYVC